MGAWDTLLQTMDKHQGALLVVLTAGIFLSGCASLVVAVYLAYENRVLRKAGTEPDVIGFILPDPAQIYLIRFHLKNVGRGPAFNISFEVDGDQARLKSDGVEMPMGDNRSPISALPQDSELITFFGMGHELFKDPQPGPILVKISYENGKGHRFSRTAVLDIAQFDGFRQIGTPPLKELVKIMKDMQRDIGQLTSGSKRPKIVTASPSEWREEDERVAEEMEEYWRKQADRAKES